MPATAVLAIDRSRRLFAKLSMAVVAVDRVNASDCQITLKLVREDGLLRLGTYASCHDDQSSQCYYDALASSYRLC